jgi:hypothetical protein
MELEVTWGRAAKVWWSMFWSMIIFCLICGIALGIIVGVTRLIVARGMGISPVYLNVIEMILLFGIAVVGQVYGIKKVLKKKYSDFRVAVIGGE